MTNPTDRLIVLFCASFKDMIAAGARRERGACVTIRKLD